MRKKGEEDLNGNTGYYALVYKQCCTFFLVRSDSDRTDDQIPIHLHSPFSYAFRKPLPGPGPQCYVLLWEVLPDSYSVDLVRGIFNQVESCLISFSELFLTYSER
jgi:hypothetical protein